MSDATLFDVEPAATEYEWPAGSCSCRTCGICTTENGLATFEHEPGSRYCSGVVERYGDLRRSP